MKILAIESSCDETAAAVIGDEAEILSNVVVSQVDIFAAYGGVIPEVAARSHLEAILPVIHKALTDANLTKVDIDYIAVTYAPGLLGSLLIGTLTARTLAILWQKPFLPIHHLKSHIYSNWLHSQKSDSFLRSPVTHNTPHRGTTISPEFPLLALVISGGHTQIIYMPAHNQFEIIGTTRDDAVGECFDKIAKILGLPYPGGPAIANCASGNLDLTTSSQSVISTPQNHHKTTPAPQGNPLKYHLPHPRIEGLDFSFSGLKTAVLRAVQADCNLPITTPSHELAGHLTPQQRADFAASFQATACDILIEKLQLALQEHPEVKSIVFAGGVSANQVLQNKATQAFAPHIKVYFPERQFTGDNAAMVGAAAYYEILAGVQPSDPYQLNILPRTPIK